MTNKQRRVYRKCGTCETRVLWSQKSKKTPRCIPCGINAMMENAQQMHDREGPGYERWKAGMLAWVARETGPTPPPNQQAD